MITTSSGVGSNILRLSLTVKVKVSTVGLHSVTGVLLSLWSEMNKKKNLL